MSEATRELQAKATGVMADIVAREMEKIGDGKILQWIVDHQDQIKNLIALFLTFIPK